jgi:AraC-like ligand binding domain
VSATFCADPGLLQLELRATGDGRALRYGMHSHDEFSVGLIESGCSVYRSSGEEHLVGPGDLLLMNPDAVKLCCGSKSELARAVALDGIQLLLL